MWTYWLITTALYAWLIIAVSMSANSDAGPRPMFSNLFGVLLMFFVSKMVLSSILMFEDIFRLLSAGVCYTMNMFGERNSEVAYLPERRRFISQLGLLLASIPFLSILYGMVRGKHQYTVHREELYFDELPPEFDGFTVTQISDVHSGSFSDRQAVERGIELINEQASDVVLFTGDLVNDKAEEMEPWVEVFEKIKAPLGKFSILGNHDYGDYTRWPSVDAKQQNMQDLYEVHRRIGFELLRNERRTLERNGKKLNLLGVENWGVPPFPQHGDLNKASEGIEEGEFNLLMSHDPSHFDLEVKNYPKKMHLTLSGHTHGMQFGIEIPGFKWSPVKYRYPKWAGLYEDLGRYLYVNRGFGFIGFHGRVGIWPEITVVVLKSRQMA
jgi:predicted MPP superfamily phosphohydrolase